MRVIPSLLIIGLVCVERSLSADFWALIAVGSNGWENYRHQADACHAYQVMLNKGIPAKNIIVMMYDDIAQNKMNETPGKIFNRPNGTDVYQGVSIDYKGADVSAQNFIQVMTGNLTAMKGIGTGRVLGSKSDSTIFVNIIGHGGQGMILFPPDELKTSTLQSALSQMSQNNTFGKIIFFVEACDSGSLFEGVIPNNNNIIAITAAAQDENSFASYCIKYIKGTYLCLGDEFSVAWMEHVDETYGEFESVFDQYEYVRNKVTESHVSIYGDLKIGANLLRPSQKAINYTKLNHFKSVNNRDMDLFLAENRVNQVRNVLNGSKYSDLLEKREIADNIMAELSKLAVNGDETRAWDIEEKRYALNFTIMGCYDDMVASFNENCYKFTEHPYFLKHLYRLVNVCAMGLDATPMLEKMSTVCSRKPIVGKIA